MTTQARSWKGASGAATPGSRVERVANLAGKINILREDIYFLHSKNFKLLSRIEGNSITNCTCFNVYNFFMGGHCDYSPHGVKNLATPLCPIINSMEQRGC
jgi:hypothetical protein